nr:putative ribonuclease H-like domain-containing protein [Tanacetum cinerariifolium]
MVDNTLFTENKSSNLIIVQIYVDDIVFVATCQDMCDEFAKIMHDEFEMSTMGKLNFFIILQIKQMEDGIFFNQSKYIKEILKKFRLEDSKPMKTPMSSDTKNTKDKECEMVDSTKYRGMIALAISTTEAEYVSAKKACQQALWMKQALIDYDVRLDDVPIMTKPVVDTLSFDDLYNNLRVFESDVKGSTASSSSIQNVAFVSSDNNSSTNEVNTAYGVSSTNEDNTSYGVSSSSGHNSQRKGSSSYTDKLIDEFQMVGGYDFHDIEEFYKKTGRNLHFYAKEPVGFDKPKLSALIATIQGSDTKVTFCSKECENTNAKLKKLYDEQREQLGDASIEIQAYTLALKKVEAQLVCHQKNQLAYEEKLRFMKIDLDDKPNVLIYHNKLLAEAKKEKEELKTKLENFQSSSKGLSKLLNSQMSAKDKSGLGDIEDSHVNDRFAKVEGMHAFKNNESDAKTSDLASCESNSSLEILESVPKPVEYKPKAVSEPKVWSDSPIIEEYESDSDDEYMFKAIVEQEIPSYAFINNVKHVKSLRKTVKDQDTCSQNLIVDKRDWTGLMFKRLGLGYGYTRKTCFNKFVPTTILTKTGSFPLNVARQKFSSQAASTSTVRKVNSARQIVNDIRPRDNLFKSHSLIRMPFNRTKAPKANFANHKVNTVGEKTVSADRGNRETAVNASAGKFAEKSDEGFLVGYSLNSKAFRPVTTENKANKTAGPKEANNSVAKEVDDAAETLRKTFAQGTEDLLLQAGTARASSTNYVNTASTPVNTASTPVNTASPLRNIPSLEDIYEVPNDGIFTSASYNAEGAVAEFTNLESTMNIEPKKISQAHEDESWVDAMQEELLQFKTQQALYGLHQAPRPWYATLSTFLVKSRYKRGIIDKTLFIKKDKKDIMPVQVYVDDIIFGSIKKSWCDEFEALMKSRFHMSSMRKLAFFLGLQVNQRENGFFISQDKYVAEILKKFYFISMKTASTPIETKKPLVKDVKAADVNVHLYRSMIGSLMYLTAFRRDIMYLKGQSKLGIWYPIESAFDLEAYLDSDYARANLDRKSTTRGCQFLGMRLISWQCKKQTSVGTSTTEPEYVAAANCCGQVLWIHNQMLNYGFNFMNTKIYIDNESTICIVKNPMLHSKTKHIEIRHHFIRDAYKKKLIQVLKIHTDDNVADLLTKAFDVS